MDDDPQDRRVHDCCRRRRIDAPLYNSIFVINGLPDAVDTGPTVLERQSGSSETAEPDPPCPAVMALANMIFTRHVYS